MRVGQNPMKWQGGEFRPERITVCTMVHIPELEGYWAESLAVLELCLASLRTNTSEPFELMVLDNGSCAVVQEFLLGLRKSGVIDYLVLSRHNMRKFGAVNFLLGAAPGEIISVTDSDVYFAPGWLKATLEVLEAFPEAGQVSALPTADRIGHHCSATLEAIRRDPTVRVEEGSDLIRKGHLVAHAQSLGITWGEYRDRVGGAPHVRVSRGSISAFISAQDFQYTTTRRAAQPTLPLGPAGDLYYDALYSPVFEAKLNRNGLWRLSTTGYYVHHMGNRAPTPAELEQAFEGEVQALSGIETRSHASKPRTVRFENRFVRRLLKLVNRWTYSALYG